VTDYHINYMLGMSLMVAVQIGMAGLLVNLAQSILNDKECEEDDDARLHDEQQ